MRNIPDAPWIRNCELWGYPTREQDEVEELFCCRCGRHISEYDNYKVLSWVDDEVICSRCAKEEEEG